jgi:AcrR family transcriptional regulator
MRRSRDTGPTPGNDRRDELVRIAYRQIAEKGFEGLRVREVAAGAGINHATLLYYFPTKEALIQGVVDYLVQEFRTNRAPQPREEPPGKTPTPIEELRQEFEDLRYRFHAMPDMFLVLTELFSRSRRDPSIARILKQLENGWHGYLVSILERGVREGVFRSDLDVVTTATTMMIHLTGIGYQSMGMTDRTQTDRLISEFSAQMEHWLMKENTKKSE